MRVKFKETRRICNDGFRVHQYHAGETYDLRDGAAREAVKRGWAEKVEPIKSVEQVVTDLMAELGTSPSDEMTLMAAHLEYLLALGLGEPVLGFDAWKAQWMRPVACNPETYAAKGEAL